MAVFGIDQSSRPPPSAAALVKAGVKFANHYVADRWTQPVNLDDPSTWPTKCMRPAEVQAYVAAGIAMFTNWETSADAMRAGYDRGQSAAVGAAHMARLCGAPDDMVIYFSADWPATYDDYTGGIKPFLAGAYSKLGRNAVGKKRSALYGSVYVIQWAFEDGLIDYGWQTAAWSGRPPVWYPKAQLRQYPDAPNRYRVTIDGVICDIDRALTADFGQWGAQTSKEDLMPDEAWFQAHFDRLALWVAGRPNSYYNVDALVDRLEMAKADFETPARGELVRNLAVALTAISTKLDEGLTAGLTPEQVTDIKADLKAALPTLEGSALVSLVVSPPK